MSLDKLCSFYGFTRTPFRRDLAPGMLHRHAGHAEAVARIRWCINETALGVITGEVGAGSNSAASPPSTKRIALRYTLPGMTDTETRDYLSHHLKLVGRSDQLFSDDAADLIHHTSRGLPRAVNNLALQALVATYAANKTIVDESAARAAVAEVTTE
jgi:type II secretory pathway predicted ATPase ExeA